MGAWAISTHGKLLHLNESRRQHEEEGRGCPAVQATQVSILQTSPHSAAGAALHMLVGDICAGPALRQMSTKPATVFPHFQFALHCTSRASCVPVCVCGAFHFALVFREFNFLNFNPFLQFVKIVFLSLSPRDFPASPSLLSSACFSSGLSFLITHRVKSSTVAADKEW